MRPTCRDGSPEARHSKELPGSVQVLLIVRRSGRYTAEFTAIGLELRYKTRFSELRPRMRTGKDGTEIT